MSTELSRPAPGPSRRTVVLGLAGVALATVTSCTSDDSPGNAGPGPVGQQDPDATLVVAFVTDKRGLVDLYEATISRFPGLTGRLTPLREDHSAHLRVLNDFVGRPLNPSATPATTPSAVPGDRDRALGALASAETAAAGRRIGQCESARNPELARLIAAIGGCEAAHAAVLGGSS